MKKNKKFPNISKQFFRIFLPLFIIATAITAGLLSHERESQKKDIMTMELREVELLRRVATNDIISVVSDLLFLSSHNVLHQMLENDNLALRQELSEFFLDFCKTAALYDQVRFLDETGMERIRINFGEGKSYIVAEKNLQNKAKRYYFSDTFKLKSGRLFVSPFDLNIEQGQIEQPLKPIIRFGTPVVDLKGRKRGIVLLNYFGAKLIKNIDRASASTPGACTLLNSEGYWFKGLHPEDEWGFMYKDRKDRTIAQSDPQAWEKINAQSDGQFRNDQGIYTFSTIWPLGHGMLSSTGSGEAFNSSDSELTSKEYYWKIVSFIPAKEIGQLITATVLSWTPLYVLVILFLAFVSWRLSLAAFHRKQAEETLRKTTALNTLTNVLENFIGDSLGNLLNPIHGYCQLCEMRDNIDQIKSDLGRITKSTIKILTGINAYRKFSKLGKDSLGSISSVDIRAILDPLLSGQPLKGYEEEFIVDPNIKLHFVYDSKQKGALPLAELPSVSGSETAIAIALQETLINALESYEPQESGEVIVSAKKEDHKLIIGIADKGRGMSSDERDKSQLPFYKILGIKKSDRFGLGAYIALESAKYCGGDIQIESIESVGTTASVILKI